MDRRSETKRIIDIAMTVLLLCLMAYQVTGEMAHEWIGMGMTVLIIIHQILDSRPEMEGQNKNHPCRSLHLYWRDRTVSVSSERNAGLSVLPGPVRIPRL